MKKGPSLKGKAIVGSVAKQHGSTAKAARPIGGRAGHVNLKKK